MGITFAGSWIVWPILLPLAAATLAFLLKRRGAVAVSIVATPGIFLAVAGLAHQVMERGPLRYAAGGWAPPLGIGLHADGLSVVMLLMTAVVGTVTTFYAAGYFAAQRATPGDAGDSRYFWPLWLFLWAALNALFLAADIFNLYVGLELLSLSAIALITLEGKRPALTAGMRYLLVSLLGSLTYLLGVALLYGAYGTLELAGLGALMTAGPASWAAVALITLGMALKTALFPLHFWLPPAHASAPAPVSALLSALVVKASFYLLLRLWFDVFPAALAPAAGQFLGLLGAAAILWGSALALRQQRLKLLVAHSTVAQIGYLFLLFALAEPAGRGGDAWSGGVYHALSHACAKAAMFLAAGSLMQAVGSDSLDRLAGIVQHAPLSVAAFGVAGVTLMGLPPSGGFTAKWLLLGAALERGQWWLAAIVLAGGLLAAGYLFRALNRALLQPAPALAARPVACGTELAALALALIALLLGFCSAPLLELLRVGAPFPTGLPAGPAGGGA